MKRLFSLLVVGMVFAFAANTAAGTTYYVATNGSDSNDGSSGAPWATLQHAVDTIAAGDTIVVRAGTYVGCRIRYSGASGAMKTLTVETPDTVLVNQAGPLCTGPSIIEVINDTPANRVSYWVIDGLEVSSSTLYGVHAGYCDHVTLRNSSVHNGASTGIQFLCCTNSEVSNNTMYSNGASGVNMGQYGSNHVIRANRSYSNGGSGAGAYGDAAYGDGRVTGYIVEKNYLYSNNAHGFASDGLENSRISNNLIYNPKSRGISLYGNSAAAAPRNDLVYNNTIDLPDAAGTVVWIHRITSGLNETTGLKIHNNVMYTVSVATNKPCLCVDTNGLSTLASDYNVVTERFALDDNGTLMTFAQWQARGFDLHSFKETPANLFVDPVNRDYHLKDGSPAIDKGKGLYEVTDDLDRVSRPQGSIHDIGCYEKTGVPIPPLVITTTSLPNGTVTIPYSATLTSTGGQWPYSWSIISGSLPPGLSLDSGTSVISGTPTDYGTFNFTVQVTDAQQPPASDSKALSITVNVLPIEIATPFLRAAYVGVHYSQKFTADGGAPPFTWSLVSGSLPAGLSLDSGTGELSGIPTATGTSNFTIGVADRQEPPYTDQKAFSVTVSAAPAGNFYWVATDGSDSNPGTWNQPWGTIQHAADTIAAGDVILVKPGTYVGARIENSGTAVAPKTLMSETVRLAILNHPAPTAKHAGNLEIENTSGTLVTYWVVDGFTVDGVSRNYRGIDFRVADYITVRNNVVYNTYKTGIFSGFPNYPLVENNISHDNGEHGIYMSNSGDNGITRGNTCYNNVANGIQNNADASMGGDGEMAYWLHEKNVLYNNTNAYNFDGLTHSTIRNCLIYDTRSKGFSVYGGDAAVSSHEDRFLNNTVVSPASAYYDLMILDTGKAVKPLGHRVFNNILYNYSTASNRGSICMASSSVGDFQSDFNVVMNYFGFDDNAWQETLAQWRARGFDINSIQAADTALFVDPTNKDFHLKDGSPAIDAGCGLTDVTDDLDGNTRPIGSIHDIGCYEKTGVLPGPLTITTTSLPNATLDSAYSATLYCKGGVWPYTWSISAGSLPPGLSLEASTGKITGTPTEYGTFDFTAKVTDSLSQEATKDLSILVLVPPIDITTPWLREGYVGAQYLQEFATTGGAKPFTWSLASGTLPPGITLNSAAGSISGTPTTTGKSDFTIGVADRQEPPSTDQKAFSVTIKATAPGATIRWVAPSGNDSGEGTYTSPWRTLQYAVDNAQAGEIINVKAGTYVGCRIENSGTAAAPKTIASCTVGSAVINLPNAARAKHNGGMEIENFSARVSYWVVDGFTVDGVNRQYRAIDFRNADNITIRNNIVLQAYKTGIFSGFAEHALVENNVSHDNGEHGIYMSNSADNGISRGNTCYGNVANGLQNNADVSMGGDGEMSNWLHERNTLYSNTNGYNFDGLTHSTIRNNLIYNNKSKGFSVYGGDSAVSSHNDRFLNNTVVNQATAYYDLFIVDNGKPEKPLGHRVFNNILYNYSTSSNRGSICMASTCTGDFQSDYNVVMNYFGFDDNAWTETLAQWRARGFDIHSIQAADTVLFVDPATNNYHLKDGSPAIDAGTYVADSCEDLEGSARPQGLSHDMGCYEKAGTVSDLVITTTSLPDGAISAAYRQWIDATGGVRPLTWSISAGSLPAGLAFDAATGVIEGVPAGPVGASNFTVLATDSQQPADTASKALSINIKPADLVITTTSLPDGTVGVAYSETLTAAGGVTPYTWSIASGSLPSGLSLNSSTGQISGTPTTAGTSNFTARVTDSQVPADTADQPLSIIVSAAPTQVTITTTSLPNGTVGAAYSQTLAATGGVTPYTWSILSGSLPAGLSLNSSTGEISGTPTTIETANFTVQVADSQVPASTDQKALSITINPADLVITTASLPDGQIGVPYSQTLQATGGVTPYTWSIDSGALPPGLSLSPSTGVISGTPTTAGLSNFTVKVTDSQSTPDTATKALSINIPADLVITTSSLPAGQIGVAYSQTLAASGGKTPYSWSLDAGTLPAGLSLSSGGVISGTPTTAGTSNFTVKVTDSQVPADTATKALSITIPPDLVVTTSSLPDGQVGVVYSQTLAATGGVTPYSWSLVSGSLPAGLSLSSGGVISGTPTTAGTSNFTVRVTDSQTPADTADKALSIAILGAPNTYEFVANDSEVSTTSTSWQTRTTLTFTPPQADTWVILGFAEYKGSSTSYDTKVRMVVDGTTRSDVVKRTNNSSDYVSFVTSYVTDLSAAAHTVTIDYCSSGTSNTARLRNARIMAIRKAALEMANAAAESTVALTTTMTNYVTLQFTPATAGEYLLVWTAEFSANTSYSTEVHALYNGATADDTYYRPRANTDYVTFSSFAVRTCAASQQTLNIAAAKQSGSTATHNIRRCRVAAIRLSNGRFAGYQSAADDTKSTTTSTAFQQKLSKSWSVGTTANWLVLSSGQVTGSSTNQSTEARVQLDDATTMGQPMRRPRATSDNLGIGCVDVRNLSAGTRRVDVDWRSTNTNATAGILYVHVIALPL